MARNFLDEDEHKKSVGYTDGFRFGFGFFIANLIGITMVIALAAGINILLLHAR